jgi:hypothetical protein
MITGASRPVAATRSRSPSSGRRTPAKTWKPTRDRWRAHASPRPEEAPVMTTARPAGGVGPDDFDTCFLRVQDFGGGQDRVRRSRAAPPAPPRPPRCTGTWADVVFYPPVDGIGRPTVEGVDGKARDELARETRRSAIVPRSRTERRARRRDGSWRRSGRRTPRRVRRGERRDPPPLVRLHSPTGLSWLFMKSPLHPKRG